MLLDTNVISALRHRNRAQSNVWYWASQFRFDDFYLSSMTVLEIEKGILLIERRDDVQGGILRRWLEGDILKNFSWRILPVDAAVARRSASLHVPNPRPERDALIAATALVHNLTLVTRNTKDFAETGVKLFNPWESPGPHP